MSANALTPGELIRTSTKSDACNELNRRWHVQRVLDVRAASIHHVFVALSVVVIVLAIWCYNYGSYAPEYRFTVRMDAPSDLGTGLMATIDAQGSVFRRIAADPQGTLMFRQHGVLFRVAVLVAIENYPPGGSLRRAKITAIVPSSHRMIETQVDDGILVVQLKDVPLRTLLQRQETP